MSKKSLILIAISFLLFLTASVMRVVTFKRLQKHTTEIELAGNVIASLHQLANHVKSAQLYSRNQEQSVNFNLFRQYREEAEMIPGEVARLSKLVQHNKDLQPHWKTVVLTIKAHLPTLMQKDVGEIITSGETWRFGALLRINSSIRFMVQTEQERLKEKKQNLDAAILWTNIVSFVLVVIAVVIIATIFSSNLRLSRKGRWLEGFLGSVLNTSQNGILSYKAQRISGEITGFTLAYINDAATRIFGKAKNKGDDFLYKNGLLETCKHIVNTGEKKELELLYEKGGNELWLQLLLAKRDDGVTISLNDISAIKQYQEDLKSTISQLERSNSELEQYAYAASHDLQEPLRKIQTFGNFLQESEADRLTDKGRQYLDKILMSSARMVTLIRDLLNFSSLQKKTPYEPVALQEILESVLQDLELVITQKEASIKWNELPQIEASPLQMHQLFYNLLNNALKFCSPERKPIITIQYKELAPSEMALFPHLNDALSYIKITFSDNGIGINAEHTKQIFGLFKRLNSQEAYTGSGIGLALCKRVVENHNGHIFAEGITDEGTSFYVLLPIKQLLKTTLPEDAMHAL